MRLIHATYGRLEALVFPGDAAPLSIADSRGRTVDGVLAGLVRNLAPTREAPAWPQGSDSDRVQPGGLRRG